MIYFHYSFAAFAFAWIVGHSKITLDFRTWLAPRSRFLISLLECVGCLGFHSGWIAYLLGARLTGFGNPWIDMAALALYTTTSNLVLGRLVRVVG